MKKITKKWRLERAREIIDRNQIDVPFNESDLIEFSMVVQQDIEGAVRRVNPQFPHTDPRHLHTLIDGQWCARSWRKMIEQTHTPESEAKRVMRFLVRDDLTDFMSSVEPKECANCSTTDTLTVDHVSPPFSAIADEFIAERGLPTVVDNPCANMITKRFDDEGMEADWIHFHAERAVYQILCRSCNASKGNR